MEQSDLLRYVVRVVENLGLQYLQDITSVLRVTGTLVDRAYIEHWALLLGLRDVWAAVLRRLT